MALTPNFTTSQTAGSPSEINLQDTSTGSDGSITARRVYFITSLGTYLVQIGTTTDYEVWPIINTTISLDVLLKDYALLIRVDWIDVSGNVIETKSTVAGFTLYNSTFDYGLTQWLSGNPLLINNNNFFDNKQLLRVLIDSGDNAIIFASDYFSAQNCYDMATALRLKSASFFNSN